MTNAEKFLQALTENEEIRKYIAEHPMDEKVDKLDACVTLAGAFGFETTRDELSEAMEAMKAQIEKTRSDGEEAVRELSVEELDAAAGGKDFDKCKNTYRPLENCWSTDSCEAIVNCYLGPIKWPGE